MMTVRRYWYSEGRADGRRPDAEKFRHVVSGVTGEDWAQLRWNQELSDGDVPYMAVTFAEAEALLPDGYLNVNTGNHFFSVHIPKVEDSSLSRVASFKGSSENDEAPSEIRLVQLRGPIASKPEQILTLRIDGNGRIKCRSQKAFSKGSPTVTDFGPWPGLEGNERFLRLRYPEFNHFDELIDAALEALDFFLAEQDPRSPQN